MTLSVTCNLGTDDLVVGKVSVGDTASLTGKLFCLTALVYCPSFIGHTVKAEILCGLWVFNQQGISSKIKCV